MNISDVNQKTALMVATINGNLPFVQVLVSHGADMTKLNEYGKSLYELALAMDRKVSYFETILDFVNIFGLIIFTFFAIF